MDAPVPQKERNTKTHTLESSRPPNFFFVSSEKRKPKERKSDRPGHRDVEIGTNDLSQKRRERSLSRSFLFSIAQFFLFFKMRPCFGRVRFGHHSRRLSQEDCRFHETQKKQSLLQTSAETLEKKEKTPRGRPGDDFLFFSRSAPVFVLLFFFVGCFCFHEKAEALFSNQSLSLDLSFFLTRERVKKTRETGEKRAHEKKTRTAVVGLAL